MPSVEKFQVLKSRTPFFTVKCSAFRLFVINSKSKENIEKFFREPRSLLILIQELVASVITLAY